MGIIVLWLGTGNYCFVIENWESMFYDWELRINVLWLRTGNYSFLIENWELLFCDWERGIIVFFIQLHYHAVVSAEVL